MTAPLWGVEFTVFSVQFWLRPVSQTRLSKKV